VTAGGPQLPGLATVTASPAPNASVGRYATIMMVNGLVFLTLSLIFRAVATGHGPFASQYEFSVAFGWGIVAAYLYFEVRYHLRALSIVIMPIALALLWYASTIPETQPLVPALQNNLLLTVHVAVAIIAYGTFAVLRGRHFT
jgi:ABC-type transport system involved in cytochrome c biogenesis permease subunit